MESCWGLAGVSLPWSSRVSPLSLRHHLRKYLKAESTHVCVDECLCIPDHYSKLRNGEVCSVVISFFNQHPEAVNLSELQFGNIFNKSCSII